MVRNFKENPISEQEVIECYWYPVIDDTIGGWAISNVDQSVAYLNPYEGRFELGSFLTEYEARHIADIHNAWLQKIVFKTYEENLDAWELIAYERYASELTEDEWFHYDEPHEAT